MLSHTSLDRNICIFYIYTNLVLLAIVISYQYTAFLAEWYLETYPLAYMLEGKANVKARKDLLFQI